MISDARIEMMRIDRMIERDIRIGISRLKYDPSILNPTKVSTMASPTLR
jgi:hypothetical protein